MYDVLFFSCAVACSWLNVQCSLNISWTFSWVFEYSRFIFHLYCELQSCFLGQNTDGKWMNMTGLESSENVLRLGKMSYFHHFPPGAKQKRGVVKREVKRSINLIGVDRVDISWSCLAEIEMIWFLRKTLTHPGKWLRTCTEKSEDMVCDVVSQCPSGIGETCLLPKTREQKDASDIWPFLQCNSKSCESMERRVAKLAKMLLKNFRSVRLKHFYASWQVLEENLFKPRACSTPEKVSE